MQGTRELPQIGLRPCPFSLPACCPITLAKMLHPRLKLVTPVAAETDRYPAQHLGARTSQHELPRRRLRRTVAVWPPLKTTASPERSRCLYPVCRHVCSIWNRDRLTRKSLHLAVAAARNLGMEGIEIAKQIQEGRCVSQRGLESRNLQSEDLVFYVD